MQRIIQKSFKIQKKFNSKIEGTSMIPLLFPDDKIKLKSIRFKQIKVDDIVLIKSRNKYFAHRVIYKKTNYLITKGDNNYKSDPKVTPERVLFKVTEVFRNGIKFCIDDAYFLQTASYLTALKIIIKKFEKNNIRYVFLKGIPLYLKYLGIIPKRFYMDCDLLISPEDFKKAERILAHLGYKIENARISKLFRNLDFFPEITYVKTVKRMHITLDIHIEAVFLMKQFKIPDILYPARMVTKLSSHFLKNRRIIKIQGKDYPILNPENLIIYLALHFFHHNFRNISRLEFLNKVILKENVQKYMGNLIIGRMKQLIFNFRLNNFVFPSFILCSKFFRNPYLKDIIKMTKTQTPLKLNFVNLEKNIFDSEPRFKAGLNRFQFIFKLSPNPLLYKCLVFLNKQVFVIVIKLLILKFAKIKSSNSNNLTA